MMNPSFKLLLLVGLVSIPVKFFLAKYYTHYGDLLLFKAWSLVLAKKGFGEFYSVVWSDYLPGYLYILWLLGQIHNLFLSHFIVVADEILYKLPSILTDAGNGLLIYLIARKFTSDKKALILGIFSIFNPTLLANSTFWGQAESFTSLFLLASFYFLQQEKIWLSALLIGFGQVVKPIAVLCFPIYLIYLFLNRSFKKAIFVFLPLVLVTILLAFIPFFDFKTNILQFIIDRHLVTLNQYPYTSLNAFNFWTIISSFWVPDNLTFLDLTYQTWGKILFGLVYTLLIALILFRLKKAQNQTLFLSFILTICYLAVFVLLTRIHERHLFYGLIFSSLLLPAVSLVGRTIIFLSFGMYLFNLLFAYQQMARQPLNLDNSTIVLLSLVNLSVFVYILIIFLLKYVKTK